MFVDNPPYSVDYIKATSGEILHSTILDIGDWNMDTAPQKTIAHGLGSNWTKIRSIDVLVRDDSGDDEATIPYHYYDAGAIHTEAFITQLTNTNIILYRIDGHHFDSSNYDAVGYNRGWIIFWFRD